MRMSRKYISIIFNFVQMFYYVLGYVPTKIHFIRYSYENTVLAVGGGGEV